MDDLVKVSLDNLRINFYYRTEKLTRTPKISFSKMLIQQMMLTKKFVIATAFNQLKGFANLHSRSYLNQYVGMIRSNLKFKDFHTPSFNNFSQKLVTMVTECLKLKRVFGIFRFPYKVVSILSDAVSMAIKSSHFMVSTRFFCRVNANSKVGECVSYATQLSSYFRFRNSLWRLGTSAKAWVSFVCNE